MRYRAPRTPEQKIKDAKRAREYYHSNADYRERKRLKEKEWVEKNRDKVNNYSYTREGTPGRLKQKAESQARYRKKMKALGLYKTKRGNRGVQTRRWLGKEENKIKRVAHLAVFDAVRNGTLVRLPCEVCGENRAMGHHDDYTKPLEVRWLCARHHYEHHKNMSK